MLMHHADIQLGCIARRTDLFLFSPNPNLPFIRLIHPEEHAHKGGFSGTVFSQKGKYFSLFDA